jgi:Na+-transporting NADH:ubiquinone oxidoreductase subunit B
MERVLFALLPVQATAVWFFGWRTLVLTLWLAGVGALVEFGMARRRGDPLTAAVFVTATLLSLSLPPTIPFWMATVGVVVSVLFGKEVFGGFGRNVFNPAIVGRSFIYVCFPVAMTGSFAPVWKGGLAGLTHWGPVQTLDGLNAISAATPIWARRDYGYVTGLGDLFSGNIGGLFTDADGVRRVLAAGSAGELCAGAILLAGAFLLATRTANWRLTASCLGGAALAVVLFRHVLGATEVPDLLWSLVSSSMLFAAVFMVTDPVSAPKEVPAQVAYGLFIGVMIVFIRWQGVFAGSVSFSILLGNTVGPTFDLLARAWKERRRPPAAATPPAAPRPETAP